MVVAEVVVAAELEAVAVVEVGEGEVVADLAVSPALLAGAADRRPSSFAAVSASSAAR